MRKTSIKKLTQAALLIAVQMVLTLTQLGYIQIGPMEITLMHIPVIVGAIALGPVTGGLLGLVFGLSSMFVAIQRPHLGTWPFNPAVTHSFSSVIIAVLPRIFLGLLTAWIFMLLKKAKVKLPIAAGISGGIGAAAHTAGVLSLAYFLLGTRYANELGVGVNALAASFIAVATTNGAVEAVSAVLIASVLVIPLQKFTSETD